MRERLIIENRSSLPLELALLRAARVVEGGRVSTGRYGAQFCFHTTFSDGVYVSVYQNKKSERFVIWEAA